MSVRSTAARQRHSRRHMRARHRRQSVATTLFHAFGVEALELRHLLSGVSSPPADTIDLSIAPEDQKTGEIAAEGAATTYRVTVDADGELVAHVHASWCTTRLSLLDSQGRLLIQSEAVSPTDPDNVIDQHLAPGTYFLTVTGRTGTGSFVLDTSFTNAGGPFQPIHEAPSSEGIATADLNGDGIPDVVVPSVYESTVLVNLGVGDGTLQPPKAFPVGLGASFVLCGDFNGDGKVDLAVADRISNDVLILDGHGDGTFTTGTRIATRQGPVGLAAGDFDGDGQLDLAVADQSSNCVEVFRGDGHGQFSWSARIDGLESPWSVAAADFSGDGLPDLAVANRDGTQVDILQGRGDGTFGLQQRLTVGAGTRSVIAADFNEDGRPDLAAVSPNDGTVAVFLNAGSQSFQSPLRLNAGTLPADLVAADFSGDGHLDLAVANYGSANVFVFPGHGDGTFGGVETVPTGNGPISIAPADFNQDGKPGLAVYQTTDSTVSILVNKGDGSFFTHATTAPPPSPLSELVTDLNGDQMPDIVVTNHGTNQVAVMLGRGNGLFSEPKLIPAGQGPSDTAAGDFNGDGIPDLAVADTDSNSVTILRGRGDGTFEPATTLLAGVDPYRIRAADFDRDGHLDLVVVNSSSNDLSVFYGRADGTFAPQVRIPVGQTPSDVAVGDFNGDGYPDLAVTTSGTNEVEILLGTASNGFHPLETYAGGSLPSAPVAVDVNGDGRLDLVLTNIEPTGASEVTVFLGRGNGTFAPPSVTPVGYAVYPLATGDFNGDHRVDLVVGSEATNELFLLTGLGDGTFAEPVSLPCGQVPYAIAVADVNNDQRADIITANLQSNDVTVSLGHGNGTFAEPTKLSLVAAKRPIVSADLNNDGRTEILVANPEAGTIDIRQGDGDGGYQNVTTINVGGQPTALLAADFNRDGRADIAVADARNNTLLVMLGLGDGSFQKGIVYRVGNAPCALGVGDFNGDGILDLAVADAVSNDVEILYGDARGTGTFRPGMTLSVGAEPIDLSVADLNGDGRPDLVVANRGTNDVTFLWNDGITGFHRTTWTAPGIVPSAIVAADLDGDGTIDVAIADRAGNRVLVLWGRGGGRFSNAAAFDVGVAPDDLVATDLESKDVVTHDLIVSNSGSGTLSVLCDFQNGTLAQCFTLNLRDRAAGLVADTLNSDVHPDLAVASAGSSDVQVYLGDGDGGFVASQANVLFPHAAPIVADIWNRGAQDVLVLDARGTLLLRHGRPGAPGEFDSEISITAGTGVALRDMALLTTSQGPLVAVLDAHEPVIWLARPMPSGAYTSESLALPEGGIYTRILACDFGPCGGGTLVVLDRGGNRVFLYRMDRNGKLTADPTSIAVGLSPTDATWVAPVQDGEGRLAVTNGESGDVSIIPIARDGSVGPETRIRAGLSAANVESLAGGLARSSPDQPVRIAAGVFDPSGLTSLAVALRGANRVSILKQTSDGAFADPNEATTLVTGQNPTQIVTARLTKSGYDDLVVLNEGSQDISLFLNNGHGGFTTMPRIDAGDRPTGIAVRDVNGDGMPDLVVSNNNGDVLILLGKGGGVFEPYQRADLTVNLAVGDLTGSGHADVVLSNASLDELTVESAQDSSTFLQGRGNGLLAPGPVAIADVNGDGIPDVVVTNTGANDILVYTGLGGARFAAPRRFFTGTAPSGLTIADLNGDGLADMVVANSGSNDLTILLGARGPGGWTMAPGPRLNVGQRPVSTTVADVFGRGIPDILCVNQDSNTVSLLLGLGGGFFDDRHARVFQTGTAPIQAFFGRFSPDSAAGLVVLDSQSNDMTYYADIRGKYAAPEMIQTGGLQPVAGVMGDFNHDGFADLVVANNADSRINLFSGGPKGPRLEQSTSLSPTARPTGIAIADTPQDGFQVFVSAEGQNRAFAVTFAKTEAPPITALTPPNEPVGAVPASVVPSGATESVRLVAAYTPVLFGEATSAASTQTASVVAAGAQAAASIAVAVQTGGFVGAISQAIQPAFASSLGSLAWLVDNLLQMGQAKSWDLYPVGDLDVASVAVILPMSSLSDSELLESDMLTDVSMPAEAWTGTSAHALREPLRALSNVESFLADLDNSFNYVQVKPFDAEDRRASQDLDWVWHQSNARSGSEPRLALRSLAVGQRRLPAAHETDGASDAVDALPIEALRELAWSFEREDAPESQSDQESAWLLPVATSVAVITLSSALMRWTNRGKKLWGRIQRFRTPSTRQPGSPSDLRFPLGPTVMPPFRTVHEQPASNETLRRNPSRSETRFDPPRLRRMRGPDHHAR